MQEKITKHQTIFTLSKHCQEASDDHVTTQVGHSSIIKSFLHIGNMMQAKTYTDDIWYLLSKTLKLIVHLKQRATMAYVARAHVAFRQ